MTRVYIYATEGMYQGYHGICNFGVEEVRDREEADEYGFEWAQNLIEDYGLEDEYYDEDVSGVEPEFMWQVFKIRDDVTKSMDKLNELRWQLGHESFIEEYCEPEEWE